MPLPARLIAAVLLLAFVGIGQAATLRPEAVLNDGQLRLGDLFDGLGPEAEIVVGPAPEPGRRAIYDAAWLVRTAQAFQIDWRPVTGAEQVVVTRASIVLGAADIVARVEPALLDATGATELAVELDNRAQRLHFAADRTLDIQVEGLQFDGGTRRFSAELVGHVADGQPTRHRVTGRAYEVIELPVLARRVRRGEIIQAADLAWTTQRGDRIRPDVVHDPAELIGFEAKRALNPNQPLSHRDVATATLVARGAMVTLIVQTPTLAVTAQGRALDKGGAGDIIRVVNIASNRVVQAHVTGPNLVTVYPDGVPVLPPAPGAAQQLQPPSANN